MRILITGARGYLTQALIPTLSPDHDLVLTDLHADDSNPDFPVHGLDLADFDSLFALIQEHRPDQIINTAAISLPDWAEDHRDVTYAANVTAVKNLIRCCKEENIFLLQMSTEYVFSGENPPYMEDDMRGPVNYYGETKCDAEKLLQSSEIQFTICRATALYGLKQASRRDLFSGTYEKLKAGENVKASPLQATSPTLVYDLVTTLKYLVEHKIRGVYHTCGPEMISRYKFARRICQVFNFDENLVEKQDIIPKRAVRPVNSALSTKKLKRDTGIVMKGVKEALLYLKTII